MFIRFISCGKWLFRHPKVWKWLSSNKGQGHRLIERRGKVNIAEPQITLWYLYNFWAMFIRFISCGEELENDYFVILCLGIGYCQIKVKVIWYLKLLSDICTNSGLCLSDLFLVENDYFVILRFGNGNSEIKVKVIWYLKWLWYLYKVVYVFFLIYFLGGELKRTLPILKFGIGKVQINVEVVCSLVFA